ncbi:ribokinase [Arthrobacter sp. Leaf141]|nr:ribokinase [Arthrobacter sp. Leaf141]
MTVAAQDTRGTGLDVVVVGEALVDIVTTSAGTTEHPGGSPANVAYGLGRLGVPTGFLTCLGTDRHGALVAEHLVRAGVGILSGSPRTGPTSTAAATLAPDGSARYSFSIHWDLPAWDSAALTAPPRVLHTGSIASFLAPGAESVRGLLEQAQGTSLVTYDPNIRPDLLGSHAATLAGFEDLVQLADVIKLSDEDAAWLYPRRDPADVAAELVRRGARLAVVTLGAEGALLATQVTTLRVPAVPSVVADTIGAGDSYMAALISGLLAVAPGELEPATVEGLGRMAAAAAAITVGRPGANPPTAAELAAALKVPHPA